MKPFVFLGLPSHDGRYSAGVLSAVHATGLTRLKVRTETSSFLPWCFNHLFCEALNARKEGVTHFLLLHSDIAVKTTNWAAVMLEEMQRVNVAALSVVVPLKHASGATSTGIDMPGYPNQGGWPVRKLYMREIYELPETFTFSDIPWRQPYWTPRLLVNTGVLLLDLSRIDGRFAFRFQNRNVETADGWRADASPEDYDFARQLNAAGLPIAATRKIHVVHEGGGKWDNASPWGTDGTDPAFQ